MIGVLILIVCLAVYMALLQLEDCANEFGSIVNGQTYLRINKQRQALIHPWMFALALLILLWPLIGSFFRISLIIFILANIFLSEEDVLTPTFTPYVVPVVPEAVDGL